MNIIEAMIQLRDDIKLWVTNNLRVKMDKNLGTEESGKLLAVDEEGNVVASEKSLEDIKETFYINVDKDGVADKTRDEVADLLIGNTEGSIPFENCVVAAYIEESFDNAAGENAGILSYIREYRFSGMASINMAGEGMVLEFSSIDKDKIYNCEFGIGSTDVHSGDELVTPVLSYTEIGGTNSEVEKFVITVTNGVADKTNDEVMAWLRTTGKIEGVNGLFGLIVVEDLGDEESGTGLTYSTQRIYQTVDWKVSETNEIVWELSTTANNTVYGCEVVYSVKTEDKNIPVSIAFTQIEVGSGGSGNNIDMYDVVEDTEKLKVNGAEEQVPIEVALSSDTYTDFSTIKVVMAYGESTQEAMANADGVVSGLMAEPEFELSLVSETEGFDATLVNIQCRYKINLEHVLHDYVLHVDVDSEEDDSGDIKLNSVYIQNDEPIDAVIGSVWIDTNETGLDVPGEEYNKNLYIIDSSGSESSEIDFSSYAVGDIILVTSS